MRAQACASASHRSRGAWLYRKAKVEQDEAGMRRSHVRKQMVASKAFGGENGAVLQSEPVVWMEWIAATGHHSMFAAKERMTSPRRRRSGH